MVETCHDTHVEDVAELLSRERKERLESNCKRCADLKRYIQNRRCSVHICLCHLPRLCVSKILVSKTSNVHCLLECLTELISVKVTLHLLLERLDLSKSLSIDSLRLEVCRNLSVKIFVCKNHCTVHEVSENSHQFAVVA